MANRDELLVLAAQIVSVRRQGRSLSARSQRSMVSISSIRASAAAANRSLPRLGSKALGE
jgi:hypothetical protein